MSDDKRRVTADVGMGYTLELTTVVDSTRVGLRLVAAGNSMHGFFSPADAFRMADALRDAADEAQTNLDAATDAVNKPVCALCGGPPNAHSQTRTGGPLVGHPFMEA